MIYAHCQCFVPMSLLLGLSIMGLIVLSVGSIVLLVLSIDLLFFLVCKKLLAEQKMHNIMLPSLFCLSCSTLKISRTTSN